MSDSSSSQYYRAAHAIKTQNIDALLECIEDKAIDWGTIYGPKGTALDYMVDFENITAIGIIFFEICNSGYQGRLTSDTQKLHKKFIEMLNIYQQSSDPEYNKLIEFMLYSLLKFDLINLAYKAFDNNIMDYQTIADILLNDNKLFNRLISAFITTHNLTSNELNNLFSFERLAKDFEKEKYFQDMNSVTRQKIIFILNNYAFSGEIVEIIKEQFVQNGLDLNELYIDYTNSPL